MPFPLHDLRDIERIHVGALAYTVAVNQFLASENQKTRLVAQSAISVLMHDVACLHGAVRDLCLAGWAFAAPILLRSMLEGAMSVAVIANSDRPDVTAFKYFYAHVRNKKDIPAGLVAQFEEEVKRSTSMHLLQMTPEDQEVSKQFMTTEPRGYFWYSDMFKGPTAIIDRYLKPEIRVLYEMLSWGAHLSFYGSATFRDEPFQQSINPRKDPRAAGFALISSSRLLIEATHMREEFEGVDSLGYVRILKLIVDIQPVG